MSTSTRSLLATHGLRFRLVSDPENELLDAPIKWVHSSDLPDPTPWLEPGQVLLTDGNYFRDAAADADAYVERLHACGILALGFAIDVIHTQVPAALVAACSALELPLFEVDGRTPFIAVIRVVADGLARDRLASIERSLDAQRAIARAALRPDGLAAILTELERQLGSWVVLYDESGEAIASIGRRSAPAELATDLTEHVRLILSRGNRSAARIQSRAGDFILQSLGASGRLGGVLAVGVTSRDDGIRDDLISSVMALASIWVEQSRSLTAARAHLYSGILRLAIGSNAAEAVRTADLIGAPFPPEPLRVVCVHETGPAGFLLPAELAGAGTSCFAAHLDAETLVVITAEDDAARVTDVLARSGYLCGVSGPATLGVLGGAVDQASRALVRARERRQNVVMFDDFAAIGMIGLLENDPSGIELARRRLAPLNDDPELLTVAVSWLRHNCVVDPTARALGLHRHSVTARLERIENALGLDFDRFGDRAELWSALHLAGPDALQRSP